MGELYLLNTPSDYSQSIEEIIPDVDPSYVEYFFAIRVDREIDEQIICENLPEEKTRHMRLRSEFKCPDDTKPSDNLYDMEQADVDDYEECD